MIESIIFFIVILNFLCFMNMFADFFKFFKCRLFNKIPGNENFCVQWDITETNNWIRLLNFDNNSSFLFSTPVPKQ